MRTKKTIPIIPDTIIYKESYYWNKGKGGAIRRPNPKTNIPNRYELEQKMKGYTNIRDAALFSLTYLTGGRIREVLSIRKRQVKFETRYGKEFMIIYNVPIEKRNMNKKKKDRTIPDRTITIRMDIEKAFINPITTHLLLIDEDDLIFKIGRVRAWQIISKSGIWCHYLRHCRLSHLVKEYNFNSYELKDYVGWAKLETSENYVKIGADHLMKKMAEV